jgi:hypothetical protein
VRFKDGATVLGMSTLNSKGTATFAISSLASGTHSISAEYEGNSPHVGSRSTVVEQIVVKSGEKAASDS